MVGEQKGFLDFWENLASNVLFFTASFTKRLYVESQFNKVIAWK
jgi:hypothetical protein